MRKKYIDCELFIEKVKDIPMWGSVAAMMADCIPAAEVYTEEDVRNAYNDGYSVGMEQGMNKVSGDSGGDESP